MSVEENTNSTTISQSSELSGSPSIEVAQNWNNRLFGVYVAFLVIVALGTVWFTVAVFQAGNKVQEAIKANADARIEGLKTEGDKARAALGKTNERVTEAEARVAEANRGVEEARKETARASRDAALANERSGKLELEAETQRKLTAEANERALKLELELLKLKTPRTLTKEQQERITAKIKPFAGTPFDCFVHNEPESIELMRQISRMLTAAGWEHKPVSGSGIVLNVPGLPSSGIVAFTGLEIQIDQSRQSAWAGIVRTLQAGLIQEGLAVTVLALTDAAEHPNAIHIKIGKKP